MEIEEIQETIAAAIRNLDKGRYGLAKEGLQKALNQIERERGDTDVKALRTSKLK